MAQRKVLIPLDGSPFSDQILSVIESLLDPHTTELVLFHAAFPPVLPSEDVPIDMIGGRIPFGASYDAYNRALDASFSALEQERERLRQELVERLQPEAKRLMDAGYTVSVKVDYGDPAQCIVDAILDGEFTMVAMVTHGRTGLRHLLMGSVAEHVLRHVTIPLLLLRPNQ